MISEFALVSFFPHSCDDILWPKELKGGRVYSAHCSGVQSTMVAKSRQSSCSLTSTVRKQKEWLPVFSSLSPRHSVQGLVPQTSVIHSHGWSSHLCQTNQDTPLPLYPEACLLAAPRPYQVDRINRLEDKTDRHVFGLFEWQVSHACSHFSTSSSACHGYLLFPERSTLCPRVCCLCNLKGLFLPVLHVAQVLFKCHQQSER